MESCPRIPPRSRCASWPYLESYPVASSRLGLKYEEARSSSTAPGLFVACQERFNRQSGDDVADEIEGDVIERLESDT